MVAVLARSDSSALRKKIQDLAKELQEMHNKAEGKLVQLSNLVFQVREKQLFREWNNPETKKPFKGFQEWLSVDVKQSRANVYRLLGVREHLKVSDKTLETIGPSRSYELVRVAREKPKLLKRFIDKIKEDPDIPVYTVQQMVTSALSGSHFDSGEYDRLDFAVKVEDAPIVIKAFAVMQALEPVQNPETPAGRGLHLVSFCQEYLSGRVERDTLKQLEEAGAFKNGNTNFKIEED